MIVLVSKAFVGFVIGAVFIAFIWFMAFDVGGWWSIPAIVMALTLAVIILGVASESKHRKKVRANPGEYVLRTKTCGRCREPLMKASDSTDTKPKYEHFHKPETEHKLIVIDEAPAWLPEGMTA